MKTSGWIFLGIGWGFTTTLIIYCYNKILRKRTPLP
jgi:glycerol uptake facilitator-like aquaporin